MIKSLLVDQIGHHLIGEAQNQVGLLFKKNGFKIFQEKKLENNKEQI